MSRSSTSASEQGTDAGGLVVLRPAEEPSTRRALGAVSGVFLVLLVGTAAIDAFFPRVGVKPVGAERREFLRLTKSAHWSDGSEMRRLEYANKLRSRVRMELGSAYAALRLALLKDAKGKVIVGDDGWLFHTSRTGDEVEDPELAIARALAMFRLYARRYAALGTKLVAIPVPLKPNAMAEVYPTDGARLPEFDDRVIEAFSTAPHRAVDVRPALARLEGAERWLPQDSHWTHAARSESAREVARSEGLLRESPTSRLIHDPSMELPTDVLRLAGVADESFVRSRMPAPHSKAYRIEDLPTSESAALALFGTSFSEGFASFIAHWTGEAVHDGHAGGTQYLVSISRMAALTDLQPRTIWVEFPIHMLFPLSSAETRLDRDQGASIGALPNPAVSSFELSMGHPAEDRYSVGAGVLIADPGLAALRLSGGDEPGGTVWRVRGDGLVYDVPWLPIRDEVRLPPLDVSSLGAPFHTHRVRHPKHMGTLDAEWVTDLDLDSAEQGEGRPGSRERVMTFEPSAIEENDGLTGHLIVRGRPTEVTLRVRCAAGETKEWTALARNGATVLLDLGELAGARLTEAEVESRDPERHVQWRDCAHARQRSSAWPPRSSSGR